MQHDYSDTCNVAIREAWDSLVEAARAVESWAREMHAAKHEGTLQCSRVAPYAQVYDACVSIRSKAPG